MHFQGLWLCWGLLFSSIHADSVGDGAETEDFDENSEDVVVKESEDSPKVRV